MKVLRTAALTAIVIAAVVVLALEPASGASTSKNVASCNDNVLVGHGKPGWRSESNFAGPVGLPKWPLREMGAMADGDLVTKAGVLVEGTAPVTLKVPESMRERVYLYYGRGPKGGSISFTESSGFDEIEFEPCEGQARTIWPGGLRVHGKGSVHLVVESEGEQIPLKLGKPAARG